MTIASSQVWAGARRKIKADIYNRAYAREMEGQRWCGQQPSSLVSAVKQIIDPDLLSQAHASIRP